VAFRLYGIFDRSPPGHEPGGTPAERRRGHRRQQPAARLRHDLDAPAACGRKPSAQRLDVEPPGIGLIRDVEDQAAFLDAHPVEEASEELAAVDAPEEG